ncbi:MAG: leucine-rich repeat domain-containing protein, partial [Clostridiales bacterium]|nr:leucine-rich repeat domain-containing protein [Clostridiales bacterium]
DNESVTGNYGFNIQLQSTEPVVEEEVLDASTYTNLTFSVLDADAKTLSVVANSSNKPTGDLIIPSKVIFNGEECTVVSIPDTNPGAKSSFYGCTGITSITLPSTLTSIGMYAFNGCSGITGTFIIPDSVTSIGEYACTNFKITKLVIGRGITIISTSCFSSSVNLENLTLSNSLTEIKTNAFMNCPLLTTVNYTGTEEEWNAITIDTSNAPLTNATKVYNYQG